MNIHNKINNNLNGDINMNIQKDKIIDFIKKEKVVTSSEIAKKFEVSWNTAEKSLLELIIDGKVVKIKKLGVNLWMLK